MVRCRPGSEAQIDYGRLGMWLDPATATPGRGVGVRDGAVMLAAPVRAAGPPDGSNHPGALRMWRRSSSSAGSRRGWCATTSRPGWTRPDLYDPKINRAYAELATHYGTLIDPARAVKPKDKPRVERPMPYVRDSFWQGREFASLPQMQAEALRWSREVAGLRQAPRPGRRQTAARCSTAVEADALMPLPPRPFELT